MVPRLLVWINSIGPFRQTVGDLLNEGCGVNDTEVLVQAVRLPARASVMRKGGGAVGLIPRRLPEASLDYTQPNRIVRV